MAWPSVFPSSDLATVATDVMGFRSVGVSNFKERHLKEILEIATIKPAVNQVGA